jgi:hypothetical protein
MSHEGSRSCEPCRGPPAPMPPRDTDGSDGYVGKPELSLRADPVGLHVAKSEDSTPDPKRRRICTTLVRVGPLRIGVIDEAPPSPVTSVLDVSIDLAGFSKSLSTPWYSQLFRKEKKILLQMLRPIHQKLRIRHALLFH